MPSPSIETFSESVAHDFPAEIHNFTGGVNPASTAWPTANLAMLVPCYVRARVLLQRLWWINGATVSGNADIGIYTEGGAKLFTAGSTAQTPISTPQSVSAGALLLTPGRYWMALVFDNTTSTCYRWTNAAGASSVQKLIGMQQMAAAFPLPSTITFATAANAFVPFIGRYYSTLTL
jgi:hypothetical protein